MSEHKTPRADWSDADLIEHAQQYCVEHARRYGSAPLEVCVYLDAIRPDRTQIARVNLCRRTVLREPAGLPMPDDQT